MTTLLDSTEALVQRELARSSGQALPPGRHAWLWRPGEVKDWGATAKALRHYGFAGVHLHSNATSLLSSVTESTLRTLAAAGLHVGFSVGMDTGTVTKNAEGKETRFVGTRWELFRDKLRELAQRSRRAFPGRRPSMGLDWEKRWEKAKTHPHRREDAARIAAALADEDATWWDCPWWWPGQHSTGPTDELGALVSLRAPQTYYAVDSKKHGPYLVRPPASWLKTHPGKWSPPAYMVQRAREQYAKRKVQRPLDFSFQATSTAGADRYLGWCFRECPRTFWWHWDRLLAPKNAAAARIFRAAAIIDGTALGTPGFAERVRAFQTEHGLTVDGWVGEETALVALELAGP